MWCSQVKKYTNFLYTLYVTSCFILTHVLSLSSVKSIIYSLFYRFYFIDFIDYFIPPILYTIIFVSITCEYIPDRIPQ